MLNGGASYKGAFEAGLVQAWALEAAGPEHPPTAAGTLPPLCPAYELYDEPRFAREFLHAHNVYRCTAGLGLLAWDTKAFATAKRYAASAPTDRLQHSPVDQRRDPDGAVYGENVAIGERLEPGQVVARWHDEIRSTQGGFGGGAAAARRAGLGHYTQIVWRSTTKVGCSLGQNRRVVICHYSPSGNEVGKRLTQVAPPLPGYAGLEGEERCGGPVDQLVA